METLCFFSFNRNLTDVADVCMDETAVSSDPVIAFLLDEVVVKDWCKRTFKNIITELQGICILKLLKLLISEASSIKYFYIVLPKFLCSLTIFIRQS